MPVTSVSAAVSGLGPHDEQIEFLKANGAKLSLLPYTRGLADGTKVAGETDESGRSQRTITGQPERIVATSLESSNPSNQQY